MNIRQLIAPDKGVGATAFFTTNNNEATVVALQLLAGQLLKEHITKTPACLLCVFGKVLYESEQGDSAQLEAGDFVNIPPMVKHWLKSMSDSHLVLIK